VNASWECPACGTKEITPGVDPCPGCGAPRPQDDVAASADATPSAGTPDAGTAGSSEPTDGDAAGSGDAGTPDKPAKAASKKG